MEDRRYYSMRTGKNPYAKGMDFQMLLRLFKDFYIHFASQGYFQEAFGYHCVDHGDIIPGSLGHDVEAQMLRKLRKVDLWPIEDSCMDYGEDDFFDVVEFLYDYVSEPLEDGGYYHDYGDCGWHYSTFNRVAGREKFRAEINQILRDYGEGFELSNKGEILFTGQPDLGLIFEADISSHDSKNVTQRVNSAVTKFRRSRSSLDERRDAVRDLADVLEYLRPKLSKIINKKDEADLFKLANNFGLRHHNEKQKTDYDRAVWYSWMFYYYLATIHAVTRLIEKHSETEKNG